MIPELDVSIDLSGMISQLDTSDRQVRFAADQAIGDLAWAANLDMVKTMQDGRFTLRRDWVLKGWRVKKLGDDGRERSGRGSRQTFARRLFHMDPYMGRQEHGGDKTPRSGHKHIAIAGRSIRDAKPTSASPERIGKALWPKSIMGDFNNLGFTRDRKGRPITTKRGAEVMMQRVKGTQPAKRRETSTFKPFSGKRGRMWRKAGGGVFRKSRVLKREARIRYILKTAGNVKPRLGLVERTREVVRDAFMHYFNKRYAEALRTAK